MSVATLTLVPWLQFAFVALAFMFQVGYGTAMAYGTLLLSFGLSGVCYMVNASNAKGPMYLYIAVLGVVATMSGSLFGSCMYGMYTSQWWGLRMRAPYYNVPPSASSVAHEDGGFISFSAGTLLDFNRVVGYTEGGHVYCVAPILDDTQQSRVNFWAVGKDCCGHRWGFDCGDARDTDARAGLVYQDPTGRFSAHDRTGYDAAARQAAAVYSLTIPERPVFLTWSRDPELLEETLWSQGSILLMVVVGIYLVASILAGTMLHTLGHRVSYWV